MSRLGPPLLILGLGMAFFAPLWLSPGQVLYSDHSDVLAEHLPAKRFLVREVWQTGEIPLWCPYLFCGSPFVHDVQVGIFYPPHLLLYLAGEQNVGVVLSWLVVGHVVLAGWCMYAYARAQNLGPAASLVAAAGYMFAGKWLLHLLGGGHYIVVGLAWLPLVTLCLEQAIRKRSFFWATAAGAVFGVLALGTQPQWTFYSGIFLALWTLGECRLRLSDPGAKSQAALWLGFGAWTAVLAVGLAAIQFLPTLEAAGQSMRSAGVPLGDLFDGCVRAIQFFFGPALAVPPGATALQWEDRGGFGVVWIAAAAMAPFLRGGKVRFQAGVAVLLILFSVGGCLLFASLPGFSFFRQHSRMLMIVTFPVAFLAGVTTQSLLTDVLTPRREKFGRQVLVRVMIGAAILCVGMAIKISLEGVSLRFHPYWVSLLLTLPLTYWLLRPGREKPVMWAWLWGGILLVDLWSLTWPLVQARPEAEVYPPSPCVEFLKQHRGEGRVLDVDAPGTATSPLGTGVPVAVMDQLEAVRGYSPLDLLRFKEYLQFITDKDEPLRPLSQDNPLTFPVLTGFPGEKFPLKNRPLVDLLGVRYLLQPRDLPPPGEGWVKEDVEDENPRAFDFVLGGVRELPPYTVYTNTKAMPRAFVVPKCDLLPDREHRLESLRQTDFSKTVLIEPNTEIERLDAEIDDWGGGLWQRWSDSQVAITHSTANQVTVSVDLPAVHGYLILTDVWYPGWTCTVNGEQASVMRANSLFRAVHVGRGHSEVVFTFDPPSFRLGRTITLSTLGVILCVGLVGIGIAVAKRRRRKGHSVI